MAEAAVDGGGDVGREVVAQPEKAHIDNKTPTTRAVVDDGITADLSRTLSVSGSMAEEGFDDKFRTSRVRESATALRYAEQLGSNKLQRKRCRLE